MTIEQIYRNSYINNMMMRFSSLGESRPHMLIRLKELTWLYRNSSYICKSSRLSVWFGKNGCNFVDLHNEMMKNGN